MSDLSLELSTLIALARAGGERVVHQEKILDDPSFSPWARDLARAILSGVSPQDPQEREDLRIVRELAGVSG